MARTSKCLSGSRKPVLRETVQIEETRWRRMAGEERENGRRRRDRSSINFLEPGGPGTSFSRRQQERRIPFRFLSTESVCLPSRYCPSWRCRILAIVNARCYLRSKKVAPGTNFPLSTIYSTGGLLHNRTTNIVSESLQVTNCKR